MAKYGQDTVRTAKNQSSHYIRINGTLKVYVSTNGCTEGRLSSTNAEHFFRNNNLTITKSLEQADYVFFYACGLTKQTEQESLIILREIQKKIKNTAKIFVWGCLPKINPKALSPIYSGPFIGPMDERRFEAFFLKKTAKPFDNMEIAFGEGTLISKEAYSHTHIDMFTDAVIFLKKIFDGLQARARKDTKYIIRVAQGCTGSCTYCSERGVFGAVKSRPIEEIISEFKRGLRKNYTKFSLMATDLGSYGRDIGCTLPELLKKIIEIDYKRNYKIILNQVNPHYLIEFFSALEKIFDSGKIEELCSPVQSGSQRILELMGRRYTAEEWRRYMIKINRKYPRLRLITHFMVGFPTETDEDFKATLKLLNPPIFLDSICAFKFSERPNVCASHFSSQISETAKELRYKRMRREYVRMYLLNMAAKIMRGRSNMNKDW